MARLGSFDPDLVAVENFDIAATPAGAVDRDVVPPPEAPPPPPPPKPIRKFGNPVGGPSWPFYDIVGAGEWQAWTDEQWDVYWTSLNASPMVVGSAGMPAPYTPETEASYAIMAFGKDAVVRALTDGHVQFFIDPKAGLCAKVTETSGRQTVYAGIGHTVGQSRYVRAGDVIGVTPTDRHIPDKYLDVVVLKGRGKKKRETKVVVAPAPDVDPVIKIVKVKTSVKKLALAGLVTLILGIFIGSRLPRSVKPTKAARSPKPTKAARSPKRVPRKNKPGHGG